MCVFIYISILYKSSLLNLHDSAALSEIGALYTAQVAKPHLNKDKHSTIFLCYFYFLFFLTPNSWHGHTHISSDCLFVMPDSVLLFVNDIMCNVTGSDV